MIFRSVRDAAKAICLLTCLGATVWGGGAHAAGVLDRVGAGGKLLIGHRESSIPFSYVDADKKPVGYAVDLCLKLAEAVRKKTGAKNMQVEMVQVTSANRIAMVAEGKVDLECGSTTNNAERREKVQKMMEQVGLRPEHYQRYPHMFSGGQRQRIALARAMMLQPKVLVADEPTSALDVSIQAQVLNLFMDLQEQFNTGYVFISHNLSVVRHVADDVLVMYLGRPVEMGPSELIYNRPLHPYTQALLSATPTIHPDPSKPKIKISGELPNPLSPPSGCAFHQRCPHASERCQVEQPALRLLDARQVACHHAEQINS